MGEATAGRASKVTGAPRSARESEALLAGAADGDGWGAYDTPDTAETFAGRATVRRWSRPRRGIGDRGPPLRAAGPGRRGGTGGAGLSRVGG
ncbi:hypothetical protein Asp14428_06340 [Actinoplanes sp. NBRC 14428]|nr:hypothetical protein Asp14428_06340 [Actinoplanes sp. NBRC 14428]